MSIQIYGGCKFLLVVIVIIRGALTIAISTDCIHHSQFPNPRMARIFFASPPNKRGKILISGVKVLFQAMGKMKSDSSIDYFDVSTDRNETLFSDYANKKN